MKIAIDYLKRTKETGIIHKYLYAVLITGVFILIAHKQNYYTHSGKMSAKEICNMFPKGNNRQQI